MNQHQFAAGSATLRADRQLDARHARVVLAINPRDVVRTDPAGAKDSAAVLAPMTTVVVALSEPLNEGEPIRLASTPQPELAVPRWDSQLDLTHH